MSRIQRITGLERPISLSGKTVLVVGPTAGVGAAVARQLAQAGAITVLAGRDERKLQRMQDELSKIAPGRVHQQRVDLADLSSVRAAAAELSSAYKCFDVVVSNASILNGGRTPDYTRDGFETSIGVNHLGNAALLLGLERPIRAAARPRVVIVASEAHRRAGGFPVDELLQRNAPVSSLVRAYSRSKLANILFASQLAAHWRNVTVYSAHPGVVMTDMLRGAVAQRGWMFSRVIFPMLRSLMLAPEDAARGIVRVAVDPALAEPSGSYFERGAVNLPGGLGNDDALARRLWDRTQSVLHSIANAT